MAMRFTRLAGLASAYLITLTTAEDLLFYDGLTDVEFQQATTALGHTGNVAFGSVLWRSMLIAP